MSNAPKSSLPKLIVAAVVAESINASPKTVYKMAKSGRCRPQHRILMGPVSPVSHINFNLMALEATTLVSLIVLLRSSRDKRGERLLLVSLLTLVFFSSIGLVLDLLYRLVSVRYDQYAFYIGQAFGSPSFYVGRLFESHPWFHIVSAWVYDGSMAAMILLAMLYYLSRPIRAGDQYVRTMSIAFLIAPLLYVLVPISGPAYAFDSFPNAAPGYLIPHVIYLSSRFAPPNGLPSLHLTVALLLLYFARHWKAGLVLGLVFVAFTVSATLGLGEHYTVDLIAAIPYTALMIYLGGNKEPNASCSLQA